MPKDDDEQKRIVLFFLEEGHGSEPGIYKQEEVLKLPNRARRWAQTASSAVKEGKLSANEASGEYYHELDFYAPPDKKTGKPKKMRGVQEGVWDQEAGRSKKFIKPSSKKIGNKLRDKFKGIQANSEESGIRAQIAAKKAGNGTQSHPSDAGH